jgi:DNA-binding transcriptional LysR family regulator
VTHNERLWVGGADPSDWTAMTLDIDPAHIRSLQAIVRYGGYGRAAEALYLTQPAVSRHIRLLEEQLGNSLFVRSGRGVELTPFGETAVVELGEVLAAHDRALDRLLAADAAPFVLGAVEHVVDPLLPRVLGIVRERIGERALQVRVERSRDLAEGIERGEIDAAIVFDSKRTPPGDVLGPLRLDWWVAADRDAALPDPLPLVAYDLPCGLRELATARLDELGMAYEVVAESPHLFGVQAAARQGLGYALLSEGGDGLRRVASGPLAEPVEARLLLLGPAVDADLAQAIRATVRTDEFSSLAQSLTA